MTTYRPYSDSTHLHTKMITMTMMTTTTSPTPTIIGNYSNDTLRGIIWFTQLYNMLTVLHMPCWIIIHNEIDILEQFSTIVAIYYRHNSKQYNGIL